MQRFSCLGILFFLCTSHLLILQFSSDAEDLCDSTLSLINCTDLGSSSSVFVCEGLCAVKDFVKSKCSISLQLAAYWNSFMETATSSFGVRPAISCISHTGNHTYINLIWDMESIMNETQCNMPFAAAKAYFMIPEVINLTMFANGAFQFSTDNVYLLFNCHDKNLNTVNLEENSLACHDYQDNCNNLEIKSCVQLKPFQELELHKVLHSLNCSHYSSLVKSTALFSDWTSTGMVQLVYGNNAMCEACVNSSGQCIFDKITHQFEQCQHQSSDNHSTNSCKGFSCTKVKIVTGMTIAVAAIVLCMMLLFWIKHRGKFRYSTKSFPSLSSNHLLTQRAYMLSKKFGPVATREFSFETLSKATNSFADENIIGDGGFGAVYLGILRDGRKVAIKRLYHDNFRRMDHFYNEIKILSSIDHGNLVKLYGFCCEDSRDLLLVFEYASNGTVFDQLHDDTKPAMPWKTRLNIAQETAEALAYLHSSKTPPIYHRDVKTANILLDDDLGVKLADFGLSRLVPLEATHVSTAPQGTPGYLDPDYHQCYQLTDKSDVYSFGVVLVELVSAKLAVDMSRDRREINLSSLALMKIGCGAWEDLVDPRLEMKENTDVEIMVKRVVELGFMCLNAEKDNRPTMKCVAETLRSMYNEFGYSSGSDNALSFRMDMNGLSMAHESSNLIKTKSKSKSTESRDSIPSSNWTSSNTSSHANSF